MKQFMRLCLDLAEKYRGYTSPNPMVGAIVVKDNKIVGKGVHKKAGAPHAEVVALEEAGKLAKGSTLFVNLEPCSHFGRTPPCTEKIISSGIKSVIIAMKDPNPKIHGKGITKLQENGINVNVGICENEAKMLNEIYIKHITTCKPFVILKLAITLDGKIASYTGNSKWISNEQSRKKVHQLRNTVDAILIGKKTLLRDNPKLNVRFVDKIKNPRKIILTNSLDIQPEKIKKMEVYKLSNEKPLIMVGILNQKNQQQKKKLENIGIEIILINKTGNELNLEELLRELGKREITSLIIEGGSQVYTSFLKANLIDKAYFFLSPKIIGEEGLKWIGKLGSKRVEDSIQLKNIKFNNYGDNIQISGYFNQI
ncbi:MAG: bifunctional diaminohydroxyphosphoribosylaminopyrimidine deaminase/5-amino-6-(5-phosphoribosylamino)uracil reductase RibD [Candidatus Cloacimonetes bacterium]|nr:bifunctional diaminohydroxyphosphoribosylaminopyrimidine deaminase/5-amino-6-(5-phosphoribosylamino)uracil reductase RibD [Candidatus Cloacimonadota bacterium]